MTHAAEREDRFVGLNERAAEDTVLVTISGMMPVQVNRRVEQRHRQAVHSAGCKTGQILGGVFGMFRCNRQLHTRILAKSTMGGLAGEYLPLCRNRCGRCLTFPRMQSHHEVEDSSEAQNQISRCELLGAQASARAARRCSAVARWRREGRGQTAAAASDRGSVTVSRFRDQEADEDWPPQVGKSVRENAILSGRLSVPAMPIGS